MKKLLLSILLSLSVLCSVAQQQFDYQAHSTNGSDTYTVNITNVSTYSTGTPERGIGFSIIFDTSSSGACTLNVNGLGAITINGDITADVVYRLEYNVVTDQFDMISGGGGAGLVDGDYGDVTVGGIGTTMTIDNLAVTNAKINDVAASKVTGGAALSVTDDTNYDLTLTGSPTTSLLQAAGITIGHTGVFGVSRGGTGTGTQFTPGSILFAGTSGVYDQDNSFWFYDKNNHRVGIGVNTSLGSQLNFAAQSGTANTGLIQVAAAGAFETIIRSNTMEYGGRWAVTNSNLIRTTLGGAIADFNADVNNSGTSETDIFTYTCKASTLAVDKDKLFFRFSLTHNDATATGQIKVYFGGTQIIDSGAITFSGTDDIVVEGWITRVNASAVRCATVYHNNLGGTTHKSDYVEVTGLTLANTQIIKITAQAGGGGGGSSDITGKLGTIFLHPASAN